VKRGGKYPEELKKEAVRLLKEGGKPASEIAMELGIKRTFLYRWRDQLEKRGEDAFRRRPGPPKSDQMSELSRLRQELKEVKEERDILKKAAAYFARDLK
jgi:transposase